MDRDPTAALIDTLLRILAIIVALLCAVPAGAQVTLTRATNFTVDVARDGRLAIDVMGDVWTLPAQGGVAERLTGGESRDSRPRWAPDDSAIVYQVRDEGQQRIWLYDTGTKTARNISAGEFFDQHPDWHPDGKRIVYSSDRRDSGFDLWELDLPTGLTWRISDLPGDETEPAWSADGFDLVYVHQLAGRWSLVLRRHGQPDRVLETSESRLSAPSWRPDGTLVTFVRHGADGTSIDMIILSDPLLVRPMVIGEDVFVGPVAWRDRQTLLYTANGLIRSRDFNSWTSRTLPFRATVEKSAPDDRAAPPRRELPSVETPDGRLVIRAARVFDGVSAGYRDGVDIVIEDGKIAGIETRGEHEGAIVVDLGDVTALPGLIDSDGAMPAAPDDALGAVLLAFGITTVVAADGDARQLDRRWSGKDTPGPRVLPAGWRPELDLLTSLVPGTDTFPVSPAGIRYEDVQLTATSRTGLHRSGLADSRTAGLRELMRIRQTALVRNQATALRRRVAQPALDASSPPVVAASEPNGLPPGVGLHAELLALAEAGATPANALRAAGINAATALGLDLSIGRIAKGAAADLVIVDGDPLGDVRDLHRVIGVVRNGRFYSAVGLIDLAEAARTVE